jgi:hypothetical protein
MSTVLIDVGSEAFGWSRRVIHVAWVASGARRTSASTGTRAFADRGPIVMGLANPTAIVAATALHCTVAFCARRRSRHVSAFLTRVARPAVD